MPYICTIVSNYFTFVILGRLLSILLFGLLLYNMIGYSVVYLLEEKYTPSAEHNDFIEKNGSSNDIVIKIPVSLPYQSSWDNAEPAEGKIEHEGEYYQMKTRQLINDTMYVHCEFDQNARDRFMTLASDIHDEVTGNSADPQKKAPSTLLKSFLKDYMSSNKKHVFFVMEWAEQILNPADNYSDLRVLQACLSTLSPPPDRA